MRKREGRMRVEEERGEDEGEEKGKEQGRMGRDE